MLLDLPYGIYKDVYIDIFIDTSRGFIDTARRVSGCCVHVRASRASNRDLTRRVVQLSGGVGAGVPSGETTSG